MKAATTKPATTKPTELAAETDELGALEKELAPFAAKTARVEQLRKLIRARYASAAAGQGFEIRGERFIVMLGPKALERKVNYPQLWKLAGVATMKKIATATIKAIEEALAPDVAAKVIGQPEATGTRTLKVFERPAAP